MDKKLTERSNEELWALFPIILSPHNPQWQDNYGEESGNIVHHVGRAHIYRIHHIGSTSVEGLLAKPTVDILLEVFPSTSSAHITAAMEEAGYLYATQPDKPPPHMMFMKGYTPQGFAEKVYHVHIRYPGDWDELYFRDYLREHPETAAQYGQLKERLQAEYARHRDGYTAQKSAFVLHITQLARAQYNGRYLPAQ